MKARLVLILVIICNIASAQDQTDKQALALLDKFAAKATSAPSVTIKFDLLTDDQVERTSDTLTGSVILSRNSYRLELPDNILWYNGETSWSYLPAEKEVTILKPDSKDDSFQSRPSAIFTMHKKGYKARLIEEKPDSYTIDLYPSDLKNELIRVRLVLAKNSLDLRSLEYKRRDGITLMLVAKEYNLKQAVDQSTFTFQPSKFKDVDIIDMR
jgi:outer membrane lipoprotein-sorting protein